MLRADCLALTLLLMGCPTVETDLPGQIVHMELVAEPLTDAGAPCAPARALGDAGSQFVGTRPDGGLTFTWPLTMQWGPLVDGGVSALGDRVEQVPEISSSVALGMPDTCIAKVSTRQIAGGIEVRQQFPPASDCSRLDYTSADCTSVRVLRLTPLTDCSSRCVRYDPVTAEANCDC